ncbi:helix-turn-helix domain-containing protein [Devosia sp. 2618]|uniref:helix-turn-helix domain-containing protein n=1 Tax=Devosia sp. 2618 TaxID=3156454 RepID=UPI003390BF4E
MPEEHFLPHFRAVNMLAPASWRFILSLVALKHGVMQRDILGTHRDRALVAARHEAMAATYRHTQMSMPNVGRHFNRDHTTVLHALKKLGARTKLVERPITVKPQAAVSPFSRPNAYRRHGANGRFMPKPKATTALQRAVTRAYQHNIPPSIVAEEYGCNPLSVKVIAHHLGLKRSDYRQKSKYGREAAVL